LVKSLGKGFFIVLSRLTRRTKKNHLELPTNFGDGFSFYSFFE